MRGEGDALNIGIRCNFSLHNAHLLLTCTMFLLMLRLLDIRHHPLFTFVQVLLFPYMWAYRHHFHVKDASGGCVTLDHGVEVYFD